MSFLSIATPLAELGIPVFPLSPGTKVPPAGLHWDKEATTNPEKVAKWDAENPDYNVGLAALPDGDFCFLEFDVAGGMKAAAEEMGETQPVTRAQRSGRGFGHYIFRHTDRSRALGNRSVNLSDGNEWFSFRSSNKYLVGAGSLHPSGNYYKTVADVDPTPVPDWVCDFVEKHSEVPKPKQTSGAADVSEDFDFDDMMDFYGIGGQQNGDWYVTDECPVAGYRHQGSTRTGFFYDGNSLGFHCFAQGCEGSRMTVGQVIGFLNKEKGEPYKGVIWEQDDSALEGVVDLTDEDEELPEPVPVPETKKIIEDVEAVLNDQPPAEESEVEEDNEVGEPEAEPEVDTAVDTEKPAVDPALRIAASCQHGENGSIGLLVKDASSYVMTELQWLWPQRIPAGKITLFTGKPDCGKSLALLDFIARISAGEDFADGCKNENGARKVLIAASEDDPADTLIPRLKAAGADLTNIAVIVGTVVATQRRKNDKPSRRRANLDLKRDAKMLLEAIKASPDIGLLALDPMTSFFGEADQNKDKDIRPIMDEISRVCNKSGITIVGIIHSNKRSDVDAVHKVSGAGALAASVRAVWGFSRDTEDKSKYHMAFVKGNLGKDKTGLEYTIEETMVDIPSKSVGIPRIVWGAKSEADADDLLKQERNNKDARDFKLEAARIFLSTLQLPMKAVEIYEKAEAQGISGTTMKRAKAELGIVGRKRLNVWWWCPTGSVEKTFPHSAAEITMADSDIEAVL